MHVKTLGFVVNLKPDLCLFMVFTNSCVGLMCTVGAPEQFFPDGPPDRLLTCMSDN